MLRENTSERNLSSKREYEKDSETYNDRYKSESQRAYNEKSHQDISPRHQIPGQTERGLRNATIIQDSSLKISRMSQSGIRDKKHPNQIYTFREQNKNEEYFKSQKTENTSNEMNDSDFISGYFSPDDISSGNTKGEKPCDKTFKKIIVQK